MKTSLEKYRRFWIGVVLLIVVVGLTAYSTWDGEKAQAFPPDLEWRKIYDRGPDDLKVWVAKTSKKYFLRFKNGARHLSTIRDDEFGEGESPEFLVVSHLRWLPHGEAITVANDFARDFDKAVGIILIDHRLSPRDVSPNLDAASESGPWYFVLHDWEVKDSFVTEIKDDARLWLESQATLE